MLFSSSRRFHQVSGAGSRIAALDCYRDGMDSCSYLFSPLVSSLSAFFSIRLKPMTVANSGGVTRVVKPHHYMAVSTLQMEYENSYISLPPSKSPPPKSPSKSEKPPAS